MRAVSPVSEELRRNDHRLMMAIAYQGPFEILMTALWSLDRDGQPIRDIPAGSLRDRLARWCDAADHAWREYYVARGRWPSRAYRRR